jgi:hypothetical protein
MTVRSSAVAIAVKIVSLANAVIARRAIANPKGDGPVADTKLATAPLMRATYRDLG